ncbi:hypothetical protein D3C81_1956260 [compost metagenome]
MRYDKRPIRVHPAKLVEQGVLRNDQYLPRHHQSEHEQGEPEVFQRKIQSPEPKRDKRAGYQRRCDDRRLQGKCVQVKIGKGMARHRIPAFNEVAPLRDRRENIR